MKTRFLVGIAYTICCVFSRGSTVEAEDFQQAFDAANKSGRALLDIKNEIDVGLKAKMGPEEMDKLYRNYPEALDDAARKCDLAFKLMTKDDDRQEVLKARLIYAYVNFWLRRNYEAAVLAEHVAKSARNDDTLALDGAYLAMAALVNAFGDNRAPLDQKGDDMQLIIKACNRIASRWPGSEKAIDAVMLLGEMHARQRKPAVAAEWFDKVPPDDPKYPMAQIKAGQAFWTAYLSSARLTGANKPSSEQLAAWQKSAQDHLRTGIDKISLRVPKDASPPTELITAKFSLAQIVVSQGRDADAIKLLLDDLHSVIKAVQVPDESERPTQGITSRKFATECYKLLLRAYLGDGNLKMAGIALDELDRIVIAGNENSVPHEIQVICDEIEHQIKTELDFHRAKGDVERCARLTKILEDLQAMRLPDEK